MSYYQSTRCVPTECPHSYTPVVAAVEPVLKKTVKLSNYSILSRCTAKSLFLICNLTCSINFSLKSTFYLFLIIHSRGYRAPDKNSSIKSTHKWTEYQPLFYSILSECSKNLIVLGTLEFKGPLSL